MGEPSEDSEPKAGSGVPDDGSEQPDRLKLVALPEPAVESADTDRLALERSLSGPPMPGPRFAAATLSAVTRQPELARPAPWTVSPHGLADPTSITATSELVPALRAELAMRAHAEAGLRSRVVDAETRLAARVLLSQRTVEALGQLRTELDQLAGLLTDERTRRQAAERRVAELERQLAAGRGRSVDADREIASLRDSLLALQTPAEDPAPLGSGTDPAVAGSPSPVAEVRADRLSDALTRLRANTEPIDPAPIEPALTDAAGSPTPGGPASATAVVAVTGPRGTLSGPFRTLCRRDPALAGQLALSLLPMQRVAYPQPVSYDIVLGPGHGCVQVTSGEGGTEIARLATARPLAQIDFQVVGGPERFAKLLAAGRIRRRFGFGVLSRVRGDRDGLAALDALLALPLDLPALEELELSAQLQGWIKRAQSE
jgi:hypothetical protein